MVLGDVVGTSIAVKVGIEAAARAALIHSSSPIAVAEALEFISSIVTLSEVSRSFQLL